MLLKTKIIKLRVKTFFSFDDKLIVNFFEACTVLTAIRINNIDAHALVDTGSTNSYICKMLQHNMV